jgi:hypothetical protein
MRNDTSIKQEGLSALKEKLGAVDMERFIVLLNREKTDYTKWRENLFEDKSIQDLADDADKFSKSL